MTQREKNKELFPVDVEKNYMYRRSNVTIHSSFISARASGQVVFETCSIITSSRVNDDDDERM